MNRKLQILLIEDTKTDAELIVYELKRADLDFISQVVDSGEQLRLALSQFRPDVILSDHSLKSFNSTEAFEIFKTEYAHENPYCPFILVTGTVSEEFAVDCIKSGVDDYILKDRLKRLSGAITLAIQKKTLVEETARQTRRIIASEALLKQTEKLAQIGSWEACLTTEKIVWSDEVFRIYGYQPGEVEPTNSLIWSHIHPDSRKFYKELTTNLPQADLARVYDLAIIDRGGTVKNVQCRMGAVLDEHGCIVRIRGFVQDVSRQKAYLIALEEQNRQLKDIAWMQSHVVRAPVARMLGLVNLLADGNAEDINFPQVLEWVRAAAGEIDDIIRDISQKCAQVNSKQNAAIQTPRVS